MAGIAVRLAVGGFALPTVSATLLAILLWLGVWVGSVLLIGPRGGLFVGVAVMAILDLAALPPRTPVAFDEREVLYRTDQTLTVRIPAHAGAAPVLLLVEPFFGGAQPPYGLAGDIAGQRVAWSCPMHRGRQRIALPLPMPTSGPLEMRLQLTGSADRATDYLLVYTSASPSGPLAAPGTSDADTTSCSLT